MAFAVHHLLLAAAAAVGSVRAAGGAWQKVLLTEAAKDGAVCLDGSPGGYFLRRGDPQKWVVFHQGGGWCTNDADCAVRARGANGKSHGWLGGSTAWPSTYTDVYEGSQLFASPTFANHTVVYAMYCDGGSWTGHRNDAVNVTGPGAGPVYYRGRLLLDALIDDLLASGLGAASELLYAGCSAGALTAYLHADYVAARVPNARTVALADAMYSLEHKQYDGQATFVDQMKNGYTIWNATASIQAGCLAAHGPADAWKCLFGANVAPFVKTPIFVLNSKYDTFQGPAIIGANDTITKVTPAVRKFWVAYGQEMVTNISTLPPQHGAFLTNCPAHCQTGAHRSQHSDYAWTNVTIKAQTMGSAFDTWYKARVAGPPAASAHPETGSTYRWVETCDVLPCSPDHC